MNHEQAEAWCWVAARPLRECSDPYAVAAMVTNAALLCLAMEEPPKPRVTIGPGARFSFSAEYMAANGGPIVGRVAR